jgi:HSP20 family molecular chaperone IbpA
MSDTIKVRENGSQVQQGARQPRRVVAPPVDVYEDEREVLVVADVPGIAEDAFEIHVENDKLTIETKRQPGSEARAVAREYDELDYARSFRIPAGIDAPRVSAELKNGTLKVHLPKSEAAKPRRVSVRTGGN